MESKTLLDYALFQLTPTRTRCDLVIFSGKNKEKIATGLLEPYVSHLKSAKDQISKGGYSITLKPPSNHSSDWFTKATLQRFVRFVSTPEVLERFVTTEREMDQIESSVEDPKTPVAASKSRAHQSNDIEAEEITPKIRLQRVLESRKAMLKKEQAMAYARALVAGFETDCLYDLVSFSDAFGAHRLREACVNFMELCNKKHEDKIWMDEVAKMQASYFGTPENHDPSSQVVPPKGSTSDSGEGTENGFPTEVNPQQTEETTTHLHYMQQHVQAPLFQPYPGYNMFPGLMQVGTSHYHPGSMPWPANFQNAGPPQDADIRGSRRKHKSRKKKEKHAGEENVESSDNEENSSRKVVIRNINYIASSRDEKGSNEDSESYSSDESLKMQHKPNSDKSKKATVMSKDAENEGTLVTSEEEKKADGNWDIFQNLLMREPDSNEGSKSIHIQEEYTDNSKSYTTSKFPTDDFLPAERSNGNGYYPKKDHFITEHPIVKTRDKEDWILGINPKQNNTSIDDHHIFSGDQALENRKVDVFSDDSFMVQSRVSDSTQLTQPPPDDIFMVTDVIGSTQSKNNDSYEPEDLKMMLGQDPVTEQAVTSWSHDMETTLTSRIKPEPSNDKASKNRTDKDSGRKVGGKESKSKAPSGSSLGRSKSDIPPRSKILAAGSKMSRSKSETEEDKRKKMEELSKQRQKRIAERSSAAKGVVTPEASRRSTREVKKTTSVINPSKDKPRASTDQENRKSNKTVVMKSSTIDRLATSRTTNKPPLSTQPKVGQNRKPPPLVKKTKGTQEQQKVKVINPSGKKNGGENNNKTKIITSEKSEKTVKVLHTDSAVTENVINADDDRAVGMNAAVQIITVNPTDENDSNKVDEKPFFEKKKLTFSPEISVREISSTPAPEDETSLEHSRKKWNNGESSPKIPKGFRRLLLFGRRN